MHEKEVVYDIGMCVLHVVFEDKKLTCQYSNWVLNDTGLCYCLSLVFKDGFGLWLLSNSLSLVKFCLATVSV